MMENQNIIITSLHPWEAEQSSGARNIAQEFSKNNRVMYVNPPMDRLRKFRERNSEYVSVRNQIRAGEREPLEKVGDNLWVLTPHSVIESIGQINSDAVFDSLNRINNRRLARDIKSGGDSICFREFVLFCDSDIVNSFFLQEYLKPKLNLYYTHDDPAVQEIWKNQGYRLEPTLMKKSDIVICCTREATEQAQLYNSRSYFVGEGGDFTLISSKATEEKQAAQSALSKGVDQIYNLIEEAL